jgi:putative ABC transport system ATP-binding protein
VKKAKRGFFMLEAPLIRLTDIKKYYQMGDMEVRALDGASLSIKRGEYVAIMGPSGSGKSTMMDMLGCLDSPSSGEYLLNNKIVSKMSDDELAQIRNEEIGFVFQTFNLLSRTTALQNVELPLIYAGKPPAVRKKLSHEALTSVGLGARTGSMPNQLSGGQRQRVAVARALVNSPSILLADEPTGALDTRTSIEIMALFEELYQRGNTIILVTHEEDIAKHAHRIIKLLDGKIRSDEPNTPISMEEHLAHLGLK